MKKILILTGILLALAVPSYAVTENNFDKREAQKILEQMREKYRKADEARRKAEIEARKRAEREEQARLKAQAEARKRAEEEARLQAEAEAKAEAERIKQEQLAIEQAEAERARMEQERIEAEKQAELAKPKEMTVQEKIEAFVNYRNDKKLEEERNLKTSYEKLKHTYEKSLDKVDFYERVVRSIQREEKDIKTFNEMFDMNLDFDK